MSTIPWVKVGLALFAALAVTAVVVQSPLIGVAAVASLLLLELD